MSRFKSVYSVNDVGDGVPPFPMNEASACRVETESGTIYWLGVPDDDGFRDIVRQPREDNISASMVMQRPAAGQKSTALRKRFRGRLKADVEVGVSLALEVRGQEVRILSETVIDIRPREVPE